MNIKEILKWGQKELENAKIETAQLDTLLLLSSVLKKTKEKILANLDLKIPKVKIKKFQVLINRRKLHEPLAYILGHKEFFNLDFIVTPDVLIPRPETEILIETIFEELANLEKQDAKNKNKLPLSYPICYKPLIICDIGTGSGCIAITLAKNFPKSKIFAIDLSENALKIAQKNAEKYKITNIQFLKNNLLSGIRQKFDIICANLPYLSEKEYKNGMPEIRFEPKEALVAGSRGIEIFQIFIPQLKFVTKSGSLVFLEIGETQKEQITELIQKYLPSAKVNIKKDLSGHNRVLIIKV